MKQIFAQSVQEKKRKCEFVNLCFSISLSMDSVEKHYVNRVKQYNENRIGKNPNYHLGCSIDIVSDNIPTQRRRVAEL